MIKVKEYTSRDLIQLRKKLGLNQSEFWKAINVTQSCGSRYERGRKVPDQVLLLVELVHERNIDLSTPTERAKLH